MAVRDITPIDEIVIPEDFDPIEYRKSQFAIADKIVTDNIVEAVKALANVLTLDPNGTAPETVPVRKLQLDAIKHFLKIGGMEVDRVEHSGDFKITTEQAAAIMKFDKNDSK